MSAFIVCAGHIDYLVSAAIAANIPYGSVRWKGERIECSNADAVGAALWRENIASVAYRYSHRDDVSAPGIYTLRQYVTVAPVQVLKALDSYAYQSCEWANSEARRFCDALRRAVISRLPEYDDAAWEIAERGSEGLVIGPASIRASRPRKTLEPLC